MLLELRIKLPKINMLKNFQDFIICSFWLFSGNMILIYVAKVSWNKIQVLKVV